MALPRSFYNFLANARIPVFAMFIASGTATSVCIALDLEAKVVDRLSAILAVSGVTTAAISALETNRALKSQISGSVDRVNIIAEAREPFASLEFSGNETRELARSTSKLTACIGCQNYHGHSYPVSWGEQGFTSYERLVCGMHPSGWDGESCPDWEQIPHVYRLIRLQGSGNNCLYFVRADREDYSIDQMLAEAPELDVVDATDYEIAKALMQKFNCKSLNGLPGCEYKSKLSDIDEAWQELIDSCGQFMP